MIGLGGLGTWAGWLAGNPSKALRVGWDRSSLRFLFCGRPGFLAGPGSGLTRPTQPCQCDLSDRCLLGVVKAPSSGRGWDACIDTRCVALLKAALLGWLAAGSPSQG